MTTRTVWIPRTGAPSVLELRESADPSPKPGEVRIRVKASGINFADILARIGLYPDAPKIPMVVGYEVSGVVDGVGEGVEGFEDGDRVLALTRFGGYTTCICTPQVQVLKIPDALSFEKAAAIPVTYLTAWLMMIRLGNLRKGERILIHAVAGGVGQSATQIAKWRGAEIFGTASAGKHDRLREAGVHHPIDYRTQDFEEEVMRITGGKGVHMVLDAVGGKSFRKSYNCLAPMGRLFLFGASSMATGETMNPISAAKMWLQLPSFKPIPLMQENRGVFGVNLGRLWEQAEDLGEMLGEIVELVDQGHFDPVVSETFPLEKASDAHQYIQDRKNFGKVLLVDE